MHIQPTNRYASLLDTHGIGRPKVAGNAVEPGSRAANGVPPTTIAAITDRITGGSPNLISPDTAGDVISHAQGVNHSQSNSSASADDSTLPIGLRHYMQDIASDPNFAMQQAKSWANSSTLLSFQMPAGIMSNPGGGQASAVQSAELLKHCVDGPSLDGDASQTNMTYKIVKLVHDQLKHIYETGRASGKSGTEIYSDMLTLQASQSQNYWNAISVDPSSKMIRQTEVVALQQAMPATKSGAQSSPSPDHSTTP